MPHITLAAEKIGSVFGLPITNSLIATWVVMAIIVVICIAATRKMTLVPSGIQSVAELVVGGLYDFFTSVVGKHIKQFFPLIASFFIFIITANWFGLLPGVGTVGFHEHGKFVPLLRAATADLNTTLALAVVSIVAIQYFGFKTVGSHYGSRFFNFKNPIYFFLGILELILSYY